jgi:hypothetical protein
MYTALDGTARCHACGETARLDVFSRWLLSCLIALSLPALLLYGDVFYSGHLFVVSCLFIFTAWTGLAWLCSPILTLESAPRSGPTVDRTTGMLILVVMLAAAGIFDNFMASRFETADKLENVHSSTATQR